MPPLIFSRPSRPPQPVYVPPPSGGGGGGGSLTHGQPFTITGSGFGTKSGHTLKFDDASGASLTNIWNYAWPTTAGTSSNNIGYKSAQRSVPLPHNRTGKYIAGCHDPLRGATGGANVLFGLDFTKSFPSYSRWEFYYRLDPAWVFDSPASANNHKWYGISVGSGSPYADGTNQWYLEYRGGGDFASTSGSFTNHANDDAAGVGIDNWGNTGSPYYGVDNNPFTGWIKKALLIRWNSSGGLLFLDCDNSNMTNQTEKTDGYAGASRSEAIGGYGGNSNNNNWRYFADAYYDHGTNDATLYLTNNATWASATIREAQAYTSWSSGSITATCNGGALSSGMVHVHIRSIENGNQYLGTQTLT